MTCCELGGDGERNTSGGMNGWMGGSVVAVFVPSLLIITCEAGKRQSKQGTAGLHGTNA